MEPDPTSRLFVLTGAPGAGKTAILSGLRPVFACVDEPAREVLADQRATGGEGTWDRDASLFVRMILRRAIEQHGAARRTGQTVVFDRGVPDCVVYADRLGVDASPSLRAIETCRYETDVVFLEPWSDIYRTDEERIMSFDDTVSFSDALKDVYTRAGYTLTAVPRGTIVERTAFVRAFIGDRISGTLPT